MRPPATSDNSLDPRLNSYSCTKFRVEFNRNCLKTDSAGFNHKSINWYVTCEIKPWLHYTDNGFTLKISLFGGVKLTTNSDHDKFSYAGYVT